MTFKIKAKLADLFPPDDPNSSWLLRLAVLRDDFTYEVNQTFETERTPSYDVRMKAVREDDPTGVWVRVYGIRKLAITLGEVRNIFSHEVGHYLKTVDWPANALRDLRAAVADVEELDAKLSPIRDALGAHVRPSNAVQTSPKADPTPDVLRAHGDMEFEVVLDMATGSETTFCSLTTDAFLFAWPEVRNEADYEKRRTEFLPPEPFFRCLAGIRRGIDLLMAEHWNKAGLLK